MEVDRIAVFLRVRQLIAPAARCRIVRIDDALHVVFIVAADLAASRVVGTGCRTQLRLIILRQIGGHSGSAARDVADGQNAADDLAALVAKDIVLQLSGEGASPAVWIVISEMKRA